MITVSDSTSISRAALILRNGGLVAIPTETVYGLAANALNPYACAKIFEAKNRPHFDPLIVHVSDRIMLDTISDSIPVEIERLIARFWPGPLTVVVKKNTTVPDIVTSGLNSVAIRMPRHDVALAVIREAGIPLAAPSANPFGYLSPTTAIHVEEQLGSRIDMILDGGSCEVGVESTIVKLYDGKIHCLRPGGITLNELAETAGCEAVLSDKGDIPEAPGLLPSHYAPHTKVILINEGDHIEADETAALCLFRKNNYSGHFAGMEILSVSGDLKEAASNLFAALHRLDCLGASVIYAEIVPENGIGVAIMNRLRKAAAL
jgi:L-threonylcarbamoyladenylate synthase